MKRLISIAVCLSALFVVTGAWAQGDPTWTARANAVQAQADYEHRAMQIRLQRRLRYFDHALARVRTDASRHGDAPNATLDRMERVLTDAHRDFADWRVVSDGSYDRFRARVESDLGDLQALLTNYRAE